MSTICWRNLTLFKAQSCIHSSKEQRFNYTCSPTNCFVTFLVLSPLKNKWVEKLEKKKVICSGIMTSTVQFYRRQKHRQFSESRTDHGCSSKTAVYHCCLSKTTGGIILELHCSTSFTPIYIIKRKLKVFKVKWPSICDQFTISNSHLGSTRIFLSLRWRMAASLELFLIPSAKQKHWIWLYFQIYLGRFFERQNDY